MGDLIKPKVPQWKSPDGQVDEITDLADKIHRLIRDENVNLVYAIVALRLVQKSAVLTIGAAYGSDLMHEAMNTASKLMEEYDCNLTPRDDAP